MTSLNKVAVYRCKERVTAIQFDGSDECLTAIKNWIASIPVKLTEIFDFKDLQMGDWAVFSSGEWIYIMDNDTFIEAYTSADFQSYMSNGMPACISYDPEARCWASYCPALNISSAGNTVADAILAMESAITLWIKNQPPRSS